MLSCALLVGGNIRGAMQSGLVHASGVHASMRVLSGHTDTSPVWGMFEEHRIPYTPHLLLVVGNQHANNAAVNALHPGSGQQGVSIALSC